VPEGAVVFLYAGAIRREKGVMELLEAFRQIAPDADGPVLLVAGSAGLWGFPTAADGEYERACREAAGALELDGRVHLLGAVDREHLGQLYQLADVQVMPSQVADAGPLVALEAMAAGLPIIASRLGGLPEYVGAAGLLCDPTPRALAEAMNALRLSPGERARLRAEAHRRARLFTWSAVSERLDSIYAKALARHG
jgi:spore coat protein SA